MKKTFQPFIIKKANDILDILKEDVKPTEYAKNELCMILTQKFIDGKLSEGDATNAIFESEDEILQFVNLCYVHEDLEHLISLGLVGVLDDDNDDDLYFLTEDGKKYVETMLKK